MTDDNSKKWLFVQMANGRLRALRCTNGDLQKGNHLNCIVQNRFGFMFLRLDGLVITSPETARRLIKLGRKDARKVLAEAGMAK